MIQIGHLFAIGKNPRKTFLQWHHELGPIFGLKLGVKPWIMIGRADIAYEILHKERNNTSGKPFYRLLSEFYSCEEKGIVFSQPTPSWRQARAAVLSVLSPKKLENELGDVLEREADELIDILMAGQEDIDPTNHLLRASLNFILITCLNKRTSSIDDPLFTTLIDLLQSCIAHSDIVKYHIGAFLPVLSMLNRWTGTEQAFADLLKNKRNPFYMQLIQEALESDTDCLAKVLMIREKLDVEYVIATLNDMVIAGSDTTTVTLGWAFSILCTMPDVQEKIQQEIDAFTSKHKRLPTFCERNQVPYLIAVQKECLRFRPTTPCGAPHLVDQDMEWRGNIIPKGTTVVANMIAIHSNPDSFPEPKIFRPERFLDHLEPMSILATKKIGERDHFNFGWGRRVCPGIALAEIQLFNVFTRVFSQCTIMPPASGEKIDLDAYFSGSVGAIAAPPRTPLRFVARSIK
ncbi:cytochrome P450 [Zychaea mexicana]|uniref:cytochrome P450 n=1 Tax=Zychaea mexicana TaxID=64656 RepID=UPI0022FE6D7A|nr:cytochrome P450 [Zychaea mexicana]KAI9489765.1 cytochrome P450 [Zychaea mexicana]